MIRKMLALALLTAMLVGILGCGSDRSEPGETENQQTGGSGQVYYNTKWDQKSMKVLAIGNSYSEDTTYFLYDIAKAYGVEDVVIGNMYIGGCTLEMHCQNIKNNAADYVYMKNDQGEWVHTPGMTLQQGLQDEQWDFVVVHQESMNAGNPDSYGNYLEELIAYVRQNVKDPDCQLVWNLTWAYSTGSANPKFSQYDRDQWAMYQAIVSAVQEKVLPIEDIRILIPTGTAIQNARGYFGNTFTRDKWDHLNTFGRLVAGYMWYSSLTGEPLLELKYAPDGLELTDQTERKLLNCLTAAYINPFEPKQ
ncbi:MAG: DUF4886 domain-containing protein [Oscillospiraceae bacterium]|nr:DUF4886 domain-containing protein [Oscillospiraceae bacterium]